MLGVKYLGKHSFHDFGLPMAPGKSIGIPNKKKIMVQIPYSNTVLDFSEIYGSQAYEERPLTYPFHLFNPKNYTKEGMGIKKTQFINWLMNSGGKQKLYDDAYPGFYFLAEIEGNSSFTEDRVRGILTVTFNAYPFMIAEYPEGHDIWDVFNFELDAFQPVNFKVNGSTEIVLLNVGTNDLSPKVTSSAPMGVQLRGKTFNIPTGESKSLDFVLKSGENDLSITGNGTISFEFYKELI